MSPLKWRCDCPFGYFVRASYRYRNPREIPVTCRCRLFFYSLATARSQQCKFNVDSAVFHDDIQMGRSIDAQRQHHRLAYSVVSQGFRFAWTLCYCARIDSTAQTYPKHSRAKAQALLWRQRCSSLLTFIGVLVGLIG